MFPSETYLEASELAYTYTPVFKRGSSNSRLVLNSAHMLEDLLTCKSIQIGPR